MVFCSRSVPRGNQMDKREGVVMTDDGMGGPQTTQ
jgi:hypothetical protein